MRRMILLSGRKKTGKGTLFTTATRIYPEAKEFFFAKPIKDFCIKALGLTHEQMYGTTEQRESPTEYKWGNVAEHIRARYGKAPDDCLTARQVLQVVGTDVMRNHFDPNVWAKAAAREAVNSDCPTCFYTDLRMENEITSAKQVAAQNGFGKPTIIRLYRKSGLIDDHITECALDKFDAVPDQRSIEQGVPDGFIKAPDLRLWINLFSSGNPFNFIIDNNGTVEEADAAMKAALGTQCV